MTFHTHRGGGRVQYASAVAAEADDPRDRELGPIHLLKYLYLADLSFARGNHGATFSGTRWQFYKFGPWSAPMLDRIHAAVNAAGAQERRFSSKYREDN